MPSSMKNTRPSLKKIKAHLQDASSEKSDLILISDAEAFIDYEAWNIAFYVAPAKPDIPFNGIMFSVFNKNDNYLLGGLDVDVVLGDSDNGESIAGKKWGCTYWANKINSNVNPGDVLVVSLVASWFADDPDQTYESAFTTFEVVVEED